MGVGKFGCLFGKYLKGAEIGMLLGVQAVAFISAISLSEEVHARDESKSGQSFSLPVTKLQMTVFYIQDQTRPPPKLVIDILYAT